MCTSLCHGRITECSKDTGFYVRLPRSTGSHSRFEGIAFFVHYQTVANRREAQDESNRAQVFLISNVTHCFRDAAAKPIVLSSCQTNRFGAPGSLSECSNSTSRFKA